MYIQKQDVLKVLEIMDKFPDAECFLLEHNNSSGIGSIITMTIFTKINGYQGQFKVEISGVENW